MKKSVLSMVAVAVLAVPAAMADTIGGVYLGADLHFADAKGGFGQTGNQQDFDFDDKNLSSFYIKVEHPVPLLPNIKLQRNSLNSNGNTTLNQTFVFDSQIFAVGTDVAQDVDLSNIDATFYYEILDNVVNADIGLGATSLNGDVKTLGLSKTNIDKTVPVIYGSAGVKLPFTGLSAKGELLYSNFNDTKITDAQAELQYNFIDNLLVDVGLKAGYRILDIKLDDYEKNDLKFNFKGPYIGLDVHF